MKRNFLLLTVLFSCMLCLQHCQCKKEDDANPNNSTKAELPPITTEGKMTFGCKVNGKVWLPYSYTSSLFPLNASVDKTHNYMAGIAAYKYYTNLKEDAIEIYFNSVNKQLQFSLNRQSTANFGYYSTYIDPSITTYFTDSIHTGSVSIMRYDSVKQIIAGTFYFNAIHPQTHDTISITDGRFDLHFSY